MEDEDLIQTYIDRSTKDIRIEVRFKRGTINGWTEDKAIEFFKLKSKTTERIVVLDWDGNSIKQYPTAEILLNEFVAWRLNWYAERYKKLIADATYTLNFNLALKACIDKKLPQFLPTAENRAAVVDKVLKICDKIPLDESQIDRIASLPSYRWAKDAYDEITKRIAELNATIADHQSILATPAKQRAIYKAELQALKKLPKIER
jgi:DNA gyrase/topoisomerase IV subunit A